MNLVQFLKDVDNYASEMPKEQQTAFIHEIARILPENIRTDYLKNMQSILKKSLFI